MMKDLKWDHHINVATGKSYKKLGLIKRSFSNLDEISIKLLYMSLVRLEYGAPIWNPFLKKDIEKLEKFQHAATRMQQFKRLSYSQRLCKLKLPTLEARRDRGDLFQMFKYVDGIDKVKWQNEPQYLGEVSTRDHNKKI
jgi:hypothetical protein